MKPFLAILGRELAERKLLFVGAAFASLFPIVLPWLPGQSSQNPDDLRGGMALGLAIITSTLLALVLGATVIGRDLSERRIGFYFARPVPGWALWAGKMVSAALLSVGAGALILLSSFLAGGRIDPAGHWGPMNLGPARGTSSSAILFYSILGVLVLLAVSHAVSIMVRSRSPWLAVDLVALSLVATVFWTRNRLLWQEGAFQVRTWGEIGFAGVALVAVALAGLVQVVRGRTDLRRGHRLLSLTLWALLGAATLAHAAYAHWALRVTPGDLMNVQGMLPAPAGSWISVMGQVRGRGGYSPTFLLDTGSGRFVKLRGHGGPSHWWGPPLFSQDGSRAFWLEPAGESAGQLVTIDLRLPEPAPRRTGAIYSGMYNAALSPDNRRIAVLARDRLRVDEIETGRMLASVSVPFEGRTSLLFLDAGRVRIVRTPFREEPGLPEALRMSVLDLEVASQRLRPVSRLELPGRWGWVVSPDGRRAILRQPDSRQALIADLETARTSPVAVPGERGSLRFLEDGRILRLRGDGNQQSLSLLTPEGAEQLHVRLPGERIQIGSNVSPGLRALGTAERGSSLGPKDWTSWLLDLRTGRLRKLGSAMAPAVGDAAAGSPSARLFLKEPGGLTLLDPETGKLRPVLPNAPIEPGLWLARLRMTRPPQN